MARGAVILLLACLVAVALARRPRWNELNGYSFAQYLHDFHKSYSGAEFELRKNAFDKNLAIIQKHNSDRTQTWRMGVNHMSDYTDAERKAMNGGRLLQMQPLQQELLKRPYVKTHQMSNLQVYPASLDYRNRVPAILTAVKDQGQCGSCWAHASTESLETYWAITTGELNVLSQQQITSCAPNPNQCGGTGGCEGSIAELAFDYAVQNGITEEWFYPYTSWQGATGTCRSVPKNRIMANFTGYVKVAANSYMSVMDALVTQGPLAVNVDASQWSNYESGVYSGCNYANNISIDHVVQLVGYGYDSAVSRNYWTIRNSWTPAWGENGYIRLYRSNNQQPQCGMNVNAQDGTACVGAPTTQYTCGMCGVLFDTSYPLATPM